MPMSIYLANKVGDHVLRGVTYTPPASVWVALFEIVPERDDTGGTEVVGGSYARLEVDFVALADGMTYNEDVMLFPDMPACRLRGSGVYDDPTAGNQLFASKFASGAFDVPAGTDLPVPIGDLVVVVR